MIQSLKFTKAASIKVSVFLYVGMLINIMKDVLNIVRKFQVFSKGTSSSPTLRSNRKIVDRQTFSAIKLDSEIIRYQREFYPVKNSQYLQLVKRSPEVFLEWLENLK